MHFKKINLVSETSFCLLNFRSMNFNMRSILCKSFSDFTFLDILTMYDASWKACLSVSPSSVWSVFDVTQLHLWIVKVVICNFKCFFPNNLDFAPVVIKSRIWLWSVSIQFLLTVNTVAETSTIFTIVKTN